MVVFIRLIHLKNCYFMENIVLLIFNDISHALKYFFASINGDGDKIIFLCLPNCKIYCR